MNPKLVTWDYGKDINVTLEDAVISWEEMRILMGATMNEATEDAPVTIYKNAQIEIEGPADWALEALKYSGKKPAEAGLTSKGRHNLPAEALSTFKWVDMTRGIRGNQATFVSGAPAEGDYASLSDDQKYLDENGNPMVFKVRLFWEDVASEEAKSATELVISPDRYPGTYRVIGDSLIRSEKTGKDEAFQFVINKAKMLSEVTLTMQAEGDPSTFNMTLNVLRDEDNEMMKLVKY